MDRRWCWQVAVAGVIFVGCMAIGAASGPVLRATLRFVVTPFRPAAAPFTPAAAPGVPFAPDDGRPGGVPSSARAAVRIS